MEFVINYSKREADGLGAALAGLIFAVFTSGCVCPPCEARSAADPAGGSAATDGGGGAVAPTASRHVIWDGDGTGEAAKGWADCDKKPDCRGGIEPAPGAGTNGSGGLKFHGEGPRWLGFGWNWIGWWPEDGGTDISSYKHLTFSIRVVAENAELAPDLGSVNVSLRCSKGQKDSAAVAVKDHAPDVLNGEWHQVKVALEEFYRGKGEEFDPKTAWEFNLGTWSESSKKFDVFIDDIAVEK